MMDWQPIETVPRNNEEVFLYHDSWPVAPLARWDWVEGPDEDGSGGFCLWHLKDDNFGAMGDGYLWPEEDHMPTHWATKPPRTREQP